MTTAEKRSVDDIIADAKAQSEALFERFNKSLAAAEQKSSSISVHHRHSTKSRPVEGEDTSKPGVSVGVRHSGKQSFKPRAQTLLTNFFRPQTGSDLADAPPATPMRPTSVGTPRASPYPNPTAAQRAASGHPPLSFAQVVTSGAG